MCLPRLDPRYGLRNRPAAGPAVFRWGMMMPAQATA
ncbi:MAG: hypothetical protein QOI54_1954 [Actinomycetota bacterium]|jgi:hypothetical protein|nr:hypothetical protein [Actinomycetota bacterium]